MSGRHYNRIAYKLEYDGSVYNVCLCASMNVTAVVQPLPHRTMHVCVVVVVIVVCIKCERKQ